MSKEKGGIIPLSTFERAHKIREREKKINVKLEGGVREALEEYFAGPIPIKIPKVVTYSCFTR